MTQTIERLEQANDEAVRAREAAFDAQLRAATRSATDEEKATLQAEVEQTAAAAREAQSALTAALRTERDEEIERSIDARAELYGITREQAADELTARRNATGVIRDR